MAPEVAADGAPTDEQLVAGLLERDQEAFAVVYDRYFQAVYDFVLRTVRSPAFAEDVVQVAFIRAWERPPGGDRPHNLKAWLFTVARNVALDEIRKRSRETQTSWGEADDEERPPLVPVETAASADPQAARQQQETVELVWAAAAALSRSDYSLLDMHLRQELTRDEMAEELGVQKGALYTRLSRLRDSLERSVSGMLLARRGREDCPELGALLDDAQQEWDETLDRAVARHADACEVCEGNRGRFASPAEIFAGIGLVAVLPAFKAGVWERLAGELGLQATLPAPGSGAESVGASQAATGGAGGRGGRRSHERFERRVRGDASDRPRRQLVGRGCDGREARRGSLGRRRRRGRNRRRCLAYRR